MTGLHRIQIVDHFNSYTNRKVLEMWRIEILFGLYLGIRVIVTYSTQLNLYCRQTDRPSPHTCAHRVTTAMTEKWEDNCR